MEVNLTHGLSTSPVSNKVALKQHILGVTGDFMFNPHLYKHINIQFLEKHQLQILVREKYSSTHCRLHSKLKYILAVSNYCKQRRAAIKNVQLKTAVIFLENPLCPSPEGEFTAFSIFTWQSDFLAKCLLSSVNFLNL